MKKKILMIVTAMVLAIAMMPTMVFAEEDDGSINVTVTIKNDNFVKPVVTDEGAVSYPIWSGTVVENYAVNLAEGQTAADAIETAAGDNGIAYINYSGYFSNFDGLKGSAVNILTDFEGWGAYYNYSGWMFLVNGSKPGWNGTADMVNDESADPDKQLKDGDDITMAYSIDNNNADSPFIQNVVINKASVKLEKGKAVNLEATVNPTYGAVSANGVNWTSSDKDVAAVNAEGKVTAKSAGIARITATASNTLNAGCKVTINPEKTNITDIKAKKKAITVKWKKQNDATGYVILRGTKKNGTFKTVKTVTKKSTTSWTNKNLKSGKKYFYKVKVYKTSKGGKVYSPLSEAKGVKAK